MSQNEPQCCIILHATRARMFSVGAHETSLQIVHNLETDTALANREVVQRRKITQFQFIDYWASGNIEFDVLAI